MLNMGTYLPSNHNIRTSQFRCVHRSCWGYAWLPDSSKLRRNCRNKHSKYHQFDFRVFHCEGWCWWNSWGQVPAKNNSSFDNRRRSHRPVCHFHIWIANCSPMNRRGSAPWMYSPPVARPSSWQAFSCNLSANRNRLFRVFRSKFSHNSPSDTHANAAQFVSNFLVAGPFLAYFR